MATRIGLTILGLFILFIALLLGYKTRDNRTALALSICAFLPYSIALLGCAFSNRLYRRFFAGEKKGSLKDIALISDRAKRVLAALIVLISVILLLFSANVTDMRILLLLWLLGALGLLLSVAITPPRKEKGED